MSIRPYEGYRDSGVEWLGLIPAGWSCEALKRGFEVRLGKMLQPEQQQSTDERHPYLRAANIQPSGVELSDVREMWFSPEERGVLALRPGDLLVSEGGDVGRAAIWVGSERPHFIQNSINRIRSSKGYLTRFLFYWLAMAKASGYIDVLCNKATIAHFTAEKLKQVEVAYPPLPDQRAIVAFLDRETAKIDVLAEEQRRLIALLKEKRQAVISHAVTKGLNPTAPMKESGVEWLGEVPAHWTVGPVGLRYEVQLGQMLNEERSRGEHLRPYLRVADVQWDQINTDELPLMNFPPSAQQRYRLQSGDLLVNEGGSYVGRSAIWRGELAECYYQKALHRLRPHQAVVDTAEFFLYVMEMATSLGVFIAEGNQTTIDHLTAEQLRAMRFAFPPFEEQRQIAEFLWSSTRQTTSLIREAEMAAALLQERRAALISSAVTGKIDVSGFPISKAEAA